MQGKPKTQLPPPCSTTHNNSLRAGGGREGRQARFLEEFNRLEVKCVLPETGARSSVMLSLLLLLTYGKKNIKKIIQPSKHLFSTGPLSLQQGDLPGPLLVLLGSSAHILLLRMPFTGGAPGCGAGQQLV